MAKTELSSMLQIVQGLLKDSTLPGLYGTSLGTRRETIPLELLEEILNQGRQRRQTMGQVRTDAASQLRRAALQATAAEGGPLIESGGLSSPWPNRKEQIGFTGPGHLSDEAKAIQGITGRGAQRPPILPTIEGERKGLRIKPYPRRGPSGVAPQVVEGAEVTSLVGHPRGGITEAWRGQPLSEFDDRGWNAKTNRPKNVFKSLVKETSEVRVLDRTRKAIPGKEQEFVDLLKRMGMWPPETKRRGPKQRPLVPVGLEADTQRAIKRRMGRAAVVETTFGMPERGGVTAGNLELATMNKLLDTVSTDTGPAFHGSNYDARLKQLEELLGMKSQTPAAVQPKYAAHHKSKAPKAIAWQQKIGDLTKSWFGKSLSPTQATQMVNILRNVPLDHLARHSLRYTGKQAVIGAMLRNAALVTGAGKTDVEFAERVVAAGEADAARPIQHKLDKIQHWKEIEEIQKPTQGPQPAATPAEAGLAEKVGAARDLRAEERSGFRSQRPKAGSIVEEGLELDAQVSKQMQAAGLETGMWEEAMDLDNLDDLIENVDEIDDVAVREELRASLESSQKQPGFGMQVTKGASHATKQQVHAALAELEGTMPQHAELLRAVTLEEQPLIKALRARKIPLGQGRTMMAEAAGAMREILGRGGVLAPGHFGELPADIEAIAEATRQSMGLEKIPQPGEPMGPRTFAKAGHVAEGGIAQAGVAELAKTPGEFWRRVAIAAGAEPGEMAEALATTGGTPYEEALVYRKFAEKNSKTTFAPGQVSALRDHPGESRYILEQTGSGYLSGEGEQAFNEIRATEEAAWRHAQEPSRANAMTDMRRWTSGPEAITEAQIEWFYSTPEGNRTKWRDTPKALLRTDNLTSVGMDTLQKKHRLLKRIDQVRHLMPKQAPGAAQAAKMALTIASRMGPFRKVT